MIVGSAVFAFGFIFMQGSIIQENRSPRFDPQKISCLSDMRFSGHCVNRGEFSRTKVMVGLCGFRLRIHFHARINNPRGRVVA